jgi:hypothetical protein
MHKTQGPRTGFDLRLQLWQVLGSNQRRLSRRFYRDCLTSDRPDPGLTERDFADAGRQLDRMPDGLFARYGLTPADVAELRERFRAWPRSA